MARILQIERSHHASFQYAVILSTGDVLHVNQAKLLDRERLLVDLRAVAGGPIALPEGLIDDHDWRAYLEDLEAIGNTDRQISGLMVDDDPRAVRGWFAWLRVRIRYWLKRWRTRSTARNPETAAEWRAGLRPWRSPSRRTTQRSRHYATDRP